MPLHILAGVRQTEAWDSTHVLGLLAVIVLVTLVFVWLRVRHRR